MSKPKPPTEEQYGPVLNPKPSKEGGLYAEGDDIPEGKSPQEAKDYEATKVTLGDYLSALTKKNKYNIAGGTTPSPSHHDEKGPPPVNDAYTKAGGNIGANKTFLDDVVEGGAVKESDFTLTGVSEYKSRGTERGEINPFFDDDGQGSVYKKGVQDARGTGHTLLSNVKGHGTVFGKAGTRTKAMESPGDHPIQEKTSTILKNNKFHPIKGSPYIDDGKFSTDSNGSMGSLQSTYGRYDPDASQILVSELQNIGRNLMVAGVGHGGGPALSAILPSLQQMGLPYLSISVSEFNAVSHTGYSRTSGGYLINSEGAGGGSSIGSNVRNELSSKDSYGHMNSYFEKFTGTLPMGMITAAIGSALAILLQAVVLFALLALTQLIPNVSPLARNKYDPRTLPMGRKQYDHSYSGFIAAMRGFLIRAWGIPTLYSGSGGAEGGGAVHWLKCVTKGLCSFLGDGGLDIGDVFALTAKLADPGQAGYAATIMRVCNRDLEELVNIGRVLTDDNQNVANKIGAGLAIITEFGSVKSIRFLNLCAKIGDILVMSEDGKFSGLSADPNKYPANAATRIFKNRIRDNNTRSVYSTSELPAAFLVPQSLSRATNQMELPVGEGADALWTSLGENLHTTKEGTPARLPAEVVKEVENSLDCEYMPFYFHDLRTNEIISFHAFLEDVSDDYSPEWNSVTGFGRMDAVQIFTRTTRNVSATFMVAAHNPQDFDYIWYCLNKLTTLIYPQWSPGTVVKADKNSHIMPFSQVPTASPIVRLRIGDYIKTNYSRFNLARIFGVGHEAKEGGSFNIDGGSAVDPVDWDNAKAKAAHEKIKKILEGPPSKDGSTGLTADSKVIAWRKMVRKEDKDSDAEEFTIMPGDKAKIIEIIQKGAVPFLVEGTPGQQSYSVEFESGAAKGKKFMISHADLAVDPAWVAEELGPTAKNTDPFKEPTKGIGAFFDPKTNAIVRNFESAGGRGLAGAITSFNIDTGDAPWNTGKFGSRAPMWAKVSVSLAVIHDLPPGLDADGFNRAPIYPVGDIMNSLIGPDIHRNSHTQADSDLKKKYEELSTEGFKDPPKEEKK